MQDQYTEKLFYSQFQRTGGLCCYKDVLGCLEDIR